MKKQNRRWFITSAAVASVGLAGCTGDDDPDPENDGEDGDDSGEDGADGTDGNDGGNGDDGDDGSSGETGETIDGSALVDAHTEALRDAGSFEGESVLDLEEDGAYKAGYEYSLVHELETGIGLETVTVYGADEAVVLTGEQYTDAEGTTHRNVEGDDPGEENHPVDPSQFLNLEHGLPWDTFDPRDENVEFEESGTTTYDGEEVTKYTAIDAPSDRVEDLDATLLVNDDDVIVSAEIDVTSVYDGSELTAESEHSISSVGGGAPDAPDWVSEG